jgi:hypothetical protein
VQLLRRSLLGLLDTALGHTEQELIKGSSPDMPVWIFTIMRCAREGGSAVVYFLPCAGAGEWTVERGYDLLERVERDGMCGGSRLNSSSLTLSRSMIRQLGRT